MSLDPAVAAVRLAVRRTLAAADLAPATPVVVACSGGADSLALLTATVFEGHKDALRVVGAVVDHGLQDGSGEHTDRVVAQMAGLGVDETLAARVTVEASGQGLEAAAREARYAVLEQVAASVRAPLVLLGHTLDDQAETVLLGLARGSGGRSIAGMRPAFGVFARPLLGTTRAQTEQACAAQGVEPWRDPHNTDPRFTRSRVRATVLPTLERELGPGVTETLARTAEQLRPDMEALDDIAEQHERAARDGDGWAVTALLRPPRAITTRVLRLAALRSGATGSELFHVHVTALLDLVEGRLRGEVQLPGLVTAHLLDGRLRFRPTAVRG
ncbi:tRNA lysidine(34) synthetase TilS [Nocardioides litoris]|uniref:tRNA lysidine(34) synthetase TilS n=1 Tax=Nocardioides litoris TaxID=1926648 RepID=UPI001123A134|nr:tRNA lysidine(34) synthetase TilS [Nocardioides litoris]